MLKHWRKKVFLKVLWKSVTQTCFPFTIMLLFTIRCFFYWWIVSKRLAVKKVEGCKKSVVKISLWYFSGCLCCIRKVVNSKFTESKPKGWNCYWKLELTIELLWSNKNQNFSHKNQTC